MEGGYELVPFPPERKSPDIGDYYSDFNLIKRNLAGTEDSLAPGTSIYYGVLQATVAITGRVNYNIICNSTAVL